MHAARMCAAIAAMTAIACTQDQIPTAPIDTEARSETVGILAPTEDLGVVYAMSNAAAGNRVVGYRRNSEGVLTFAGSVSTGGNGSGGFEDTANGLVLADVNGESAPNNLTSGHTLLLATNAGSNTITVFRITAGGPVIADIEPSGGEKPVSITVNRGVVYVLNSGETEDGLVAPNCDLLPFEDLPSITGFRLTADGQLTPIPGSKRTLSGSRHSGCAQVSFTPNGKLLVVTERTAKIPEQAADPDDEGVIVTWQVNADGTLSNKKVQNATGQGPFGFTFTLNGALLTTEQFDGPLGPGEGAAASYLFHSDGLLQPTSPSVGNGGTDTCWIVVTDNQQYAYATSFFGGGRISSYNVAANGALTLLNGTAADANVADGASDLALSRNSVYLYQLNSLQGTISSFEVRADGSLMLRQIVTPFGPDPMGAPVGLAAR